MKSIEEVVQKLKSEHIRRVFVQFPEGLKSKILDICKFIEENGIQAVICIEPTFGACDVRDEEAKRLKCDAILHIGHTDFGVKSSLPVIYWEYFIDIDPIPILEKNLQVLKRFKTIGLACSLQYCNSLSKVSKFLSENGYNVVIPKGEKYPGQILGCRKNLLSDDKKVDAWLVVSAGKFHALGLSLASKKPVYNLDLESGKIYSLENLRQKLRKIIEWNKSLMKDAKRIGIIISWKKGQLMLPYKLKEDIEKEGKEVYLLAADEIEPEKLEGMKLDLLISTACPRIGIDDLSKYKIPIINLDELVNYFAKAYKH